MTVNELAIECKNNEHQLEKLWMAVYRLIRYWALKYCRHDENNVYELDDLIQSGYFALINAVGAYPEECEYSFTSFLFNHCRNEFSNLIGLNRKRIPIVSIHTSLADYDDITIQDTIPDDAAEEELLKVEEEIYNESLHRAIDEALNYVSPKQKEIIELHYYEEKTFNDIALQFGCTTSNIGFQEREALRVMRKGKAYEALKEYDYRAEGLKSTGLCSFKNDLSSSVEKAVMRKINYEGLNRKDIQTKKQKLLQMIV